VAAEAEHVRPAAQPQPGGGPLAAEPPAGKDQPAGVLGQVSPLDLRRARDALIEGGGECFRLELTGDRLVNEQVAGHMVIVTAATRRQWPAPGQL
jgi:hypothetical protein